MRSYSKKRPPVKAHEGAAQLCRLLDYPLNSSTLQRSYGQCAEGSHSRRWPLPCCLQAILKQTSIRPLHFLHIRTSNSSP